MAQEVMAVSPVAAVGGAPRGCWVWNLALGQDRSDLVLAGSVPSVPPPPHFFSNRSPSEGT